MEIIRDNLITKLLKIKSIYVYGLLKFMGF